MAKAKTVHKVSEMFSPFVETLKQFLKEEDLDAKQLSLILKERPTFVSEYTSYIKRDMLPPWYFFEVVADYFNAGFVYKNGYCYMARLPEGVS